MMSTGDATKRNPSIRLPSATWPVAYPRHRGPWTLKGTGGWAGYDPDRGQIDVVDPPDDQALPALAGALDRGHLVGYRVGRRAVVAAPDRFTKVIRPKRLDPLVATHRWLAAADVTFATPHVVGCDPAGAVELSMIRGVDLHQLLRSGCSGFDLVPVIERVAEALVTLHAATPADHLTTSSPDTPERWIETVARAEPSAVSELQTVADTLPPLPAVALTPTHGDLHDKNVFSASDGRIGLIDLDGVALAAAEDDVANLCVHLQLRALQGSRPETEHGELADRLVGRYCDDRSLNLDRIEATTAHTWFRLACIYRFRRAGRHLVPELLRRAAGRR
jgi:hypothetical protein